MLQTKQMYKILADKLSPPSPKVKDFTCMFQDYKYGISYLYDKWTVRRDADMTDFEFDGSSEEYKARFDHKIQIF